MLSLEGKILNSCNPAPAHSAESHLSSHPHRAPFEVIGAPRAEHFVGVQSKVRVSDPEVK